MGWIGPAARRCETNSLQTGKTTGNFEFFGGLVSKSARKSKDSSVLWASSLCNGNRELMRPNRELILRETWRTGSFAGFAGGRFGR
jgi:hypothetical protein